MRQWFRKPQYTILGNNKKKDMPEGLWEKCTSCEQTVYRKELAENLDVCPKCGFHFRIGIAKRVAMMFDESSFEEMDTDLSTTDPLGFPDYQAKLAGDQKKLGMKDAAIWGTGRIEGVNVASSLIDFGFRGGTMGTVVGEKIARAGEHSLNAGIPLVTINAGGGGARMQEGILSLMQMAKTSAVVARLRERGIPYISVITNPTLAGVMASFAALGDVIIAEPGALIGFTGPRVIEQTMGARLPDGFQSSEFQLEHGFVDIIAKRSELKATTAQVLRHLLNGRG